MKKNHILILACIFLYLFIITFLYKQLTRKSLLSNTPYIKLNKDSINKIIITKKDKSFAFKKEFDEWKLTSPIDYPADQSAVNNLIDKTVNIEIGEVISSRKEKHTYFEVDGVTKGVHVKIYEKEMEEPVASFILGKMAFDYLHYYFRYPESDETRVSKGLYKFMADKLLKDWRDRTILHLEKDKIKQIELIYPKQTVRLTKKDDKWMIDEIEVDTDTIKPILNTLSSLVANDFKEEKKNNLKEFGLEKSKFQVLVKLEGESLREKILVGNMDENKYYVKKEGKDTVFIVAPFKIDKLKKKKSDLIKSDAPPKIRTKIKESASP